MDGSIRERMARLDPEARTELWRTLFRPAAEPILHWPTRQLFGAEVRVCAKGRRPEAVRIAAGNVPTDLGFSRAFRASTGRSPYRWLTARRIAQAEILLRDTQLPLAEIAISCGFADQSHFSRVFHRAIGNEIVRRA